MVSYGAKKESNGLFFKIQNCRGEMEKSNTITNKVYFYFYVSILMKLVDHKSNVKCYIKTFVRPRNLVTWQRSST
jgi:hypothetical protein